MLSSTGPIGIPYLILRIDSVSPQVGHLSGFSFKLNISKLWNRGEVVFPSVVFMKMGPGIPLHGRGYRIRALFLYRTKKMSGTAEKLMNARDVTSCL